MPTASSSDTSPHNRPRDAARSGARIIAWWQRGLAGLLTIAAALAAGELVAAIARAAQTPLLAVGAQFVDRFAASLKEIAVAIFGTNDKAALVIGTITITLLLGVLAGVLSKRVNWLVPALVAVLAVVGAASQIADPRNGAVVAILGAAIATGVGVLVWRLLSKTLEKGALSGTAAPPSRRAFLTASGGVAAGAIGAAVISRVVAENSVAAAAPAVDLPVPDDVIEVPDNSAFEADGMSPYVIDSAEFYRIDTALTPPRVEVSNWKLRIDGLVDKPLEITYEQLLAMPSVELPVTLQCVSNQVGGSLVGNAVWQGVPLRDVLEMAGVQDGAEQVFSTSVDGWDCGFPLDALTDDRTALVAYAMNGEPLLPEHGFPVRLVISGLYGYVSATKWLERIELTTWAERDGYWVPRGWAKEGPIKLASRIDVPANRDEVAADALVLGGVAWLPSSGVSGVEVRIDDGEWRECELAPVANVDTWVQWRLPIADLAAGDHEAAVRARAIDGSYQSEEILPPAPDGATGLHKVTFAVVS